MTTQVFSNTPAGLISANAIADPKHIWIDGRRIVVLTGDDMPVSLTANDVTLNRLQLFQGAFIVGGQALLDRFMTYIYTTIPSTGTSIQKNVWRECTAFTRGMNYITQLRLASAPCNNSDMDQIFILGSGFTP